MNLSFRLGMLCFDFDFNMLLLILNFTYEYYYRTSRIFFFHINFSEAYFFYALTMHRYISILRAYFLCVVVYVCSFI